MWGSAPGKASDAELLAGRSLPICPNGDPKPFFSRRFGQIPDAAFASFLKLWAPLSRASRRGSRTSGERSRDFRGRSRAPRRQLTSPRSDQWGGPAGFHSSETGLTRSTVHGPEDPLLIAHTGAAAKRPPLCSQCLGDVLRDHRCLVC